MVELKRRLPRESRRYAETAEARRTHQKKQLRLKQPFRDTVGNTTRLFDAGRLLCEPWDERDSLFQHGLDPASLQPGRQMVDGLLHASGRMERMGGSAQQRHPAIAADRDTGL